MAKSRPLDPVLRARLHLSDNSRFQIGLIRSVLGGTDAVSRLIAGKPFFALREAEDLLRQIEGIKGAELLQEVLRWQGGTEVTAQGVEHIPQTGAVIIAATHPTGMFDLIAHAAVLIAQRPDLKVVANDEAEAILGSDILIPVRIDAKHRALAPKAVHLGMQTHLEQGGAVLIFGSGRVADRQRGALVEPPWRSGASRVSELCDAAIVPAGLNARNSEYYYRLRRFARFVSRENYNFSTKAASLRYVAELLDKLGGSYSVAYGARLAPGTAPSDLQARAEALVPGLYHGCDD